MTFDFETPAECHMLTYHSVTRVIMSIKVYYVHANFVLHVKKSKQRDRMPFKLREYIHMYIMHICLLLPDKLLENLTWNTQNETKSIQNETRIQLVPMPMVRHLRFHKIPHRKGDPNTKIAVVFHWLFEIYICVQPLFPQINEFCGPLLCARSARDIIKLEKLVREATVYCARPHSRFGQNVMISFDQKLCFSHA